MADDEIAADVDVIRFQAQVFKVASVIDGGIRLTLDLVMPAAPETIVALFDAKQPGVVLEVAAVAVNMSKTLTDLDDEAKQTTEGTGSSVGGGRRSIRRNEQAGGGM